VPFQESKIFSPQDSTQNVRQIASKAQAVSNHLLSTGLVAQRLFSASWLKTSHRNGEKKPSPSCRLGAGSVGGYLSGDEKKTVSFESGNEFTSGEVMETAVIN